MPFSWPKLRVHIDHL